MGLTFLKGHDLILDLAMHPDLEAFYSGKEEPVKSCMLTLRQIILESDPRVTETWKWSAPIFELSGKGFCHLWIDKKTKEPYIGFAKGKKMDHPFLETGNRTKMKIFRVNPGEDIDVDLLQGLLEEATKLY